MACWNDPRTCNLPLYTPLGLVYINVFAPDHIFVDANQDQRYITVNGVKATVTLRLRDYGQGFELEKDESGHTSESLHARRRDWKTPYYPNAYLSQAGERKIKETLIPLVREWVVSHPEILEIARENQREEQIQKLRIQSKNLCEEIEAMQKKRQEVEQELAALIG